MSEVVICPECGARSDEVVVSIFSGKEWAIRNQGDWYQCIGCGHRWNK